jgi:hypothetical protein
LKPSYLAPIQKTRPKPLARNPHKHWLCVARFWVSGKHLIPV